MSTLTINQQEIKDYEKLKIISEIAPLKEHIKLYEDKYGCNLKEFAKKVKVESENFKHWDDYIEWKAYLKSYDALNNKLEEIENAEDITIIK